MVHLFPNKSISHEQAAYLDHSPILLDTNGPRSIRKDLKPFRFEVMCMGEEACTRIIEHVRSLGIRMGQSKTLSSGLSSGSRLK